MDDAEAVDDSPYIKNIRSNLITLITPIVEVDGRDRMVDVYRWHVAHPGDAYPNVVYWGGLLEGGADIAQRPVVVDVPVQKGHVVVFANNPVWRGETIGSYFLVFNTILNWDNLNAGRKLDPR